METKRPLTFDDKKAAFIAATQSFANADKRWEERCRTGLSNNDLEKALRYELGIAGGSSATISRPSFCYEGSGLKIWASWESFNPHTKDPIFKGRATLEMARFVYEISNPENAQLPLF